MTPSPELCRHCEVACYLPEEWKALGHDTVTGIAALARAWHDDCEGCRCDHEVV